MNATTRLLPWHLQSWEPLSAYIKQQRIPQAMMIYGAAGLGKLQLAKQLSWSLACANPDSDYFNCGRCSSCKLIQANSHPDIIQVEPEAQGKNISIAQIRELTAKLVLKPQFSSIRTVLIHPADQMTRAAANGFLKYLEEPVARTTLLLITENSKLLPATIISRCQKLLIHAPKTETAIAWMQQQSNATEQDLRTLLQLAQGSPLKALENGTENLQLRKACFDTWIALADRRSEALDVAANWQQYDLEQLLTWLTSWVMDLIKHRFQLHPEVVFNTDLNTALKDLSPRLEFNSLFQLYDLLLLSKMRMTTQLNKQLMLEEILIQWQQLTKQE